MDPNVVADLRRKYSGLDEELKYITGSTICTKYDNYKAADKAAADAMKTYRSTGLTLKQPKPYPSEVKSQVSVMNNVYTPSGHRTMAGLAESASTKAGYHAERRESFNVTYQDVLVVKNKYDTHVSEAKSARSSEKKFAGYGRIHRKNAS